MTNGAKLPTASRPKYRLLAAANKKTMAANGGDHPGELVDQSRRSSFPIEPETTKDAENYYGHRCPESVVIG